jgi:DNA invertase Pin-like site-specific DNA recombinase
MEINQNFKKFNLEFSNVYIYYRVSTISQEYENNGLDNQTNLCENYLNNIYKIKEKNINYYCDIGSTYNNRSILKEQNKMIKDLPKYSKSLIVIYDVSRIGRNTFLAFQFLNKIKKLNSFIIAVKDNLCFNYNKLMDKKFYNKIIEAELSSDKKSINSLERINDIKIRGGYLGRPPFGFKIIRENNLPKLKICDLEMKVVNQIKKKYIKDKCYYKTLNYFNLKKKYNRNKLWTINSIKTIIKKDYLDEEFNNLKI